MPAARRWRSCSRREPGDRIGQRPTGPSHAAGSAPHHPYKLSAGSLDTRIKTSLPPAPTVRGSMRKLRPAAHMVRGQGGKQMGRRYLLRLLVPLAVLGVLLLRPSTGVAATEDLQLAIDGKLSETVGINSIWVIVAASLVMFMQAGFAFLEIGFSRQKNAGTVVAKILTNFSIAALCWWAVGFAFAFGGPLSSFIGHSGGFFLTDLGPYMVEEGGTTMFRPDFPVMALSDATIDSKFFFQFAFCAVSLAIVWGTTLERIKFGAYVAYSIVFASIIYPLGAHWVFGGGFLQIGDWLGTGIVGMQDFAGSTAVHLIGASGAPAALLLLRARRALPGDPPDHKPRRRRRSARCRSHGEAQDRHGRHRHVRQRRDCRVGRDHGALRLHRGVGGSDHRRDRRPDRGDGRVRDRQADRRPRRGAVGARPRGYLGHTLVRDLHGSAPCGVQRLRRPGRWPVVLRQLRSADRAGCWVLDRVHVRRLALLRDLLADPQDDRPTGHGRAGGCRSGHLGARDVRISGTVHPAGGVSGWGHPGPVEARAGGPRGAGRAAQRGIGRK